MTTQESPLNTPLVPGRFLIEASAGSGKTRAITTLIARWVVENDRKIDSILVVTFTNAATAELGERVRRTFKGLQDCIAGGRDAADDQAVELLQKWRAEGEPGEPEISGRIRAALLDIDSANVRTIHSFCQRTLGEFALEIGFPFGFELEGEGAAAESVVHRMWQEKFLRSSRLAARCLNDKGFLPAELVAWYQKLRTRPNPELRGFPEGAVEFSDAEQRFLDALAAARTLWKEHGAAFDDIMRNSDALHRNKYRHTTVRDRLGKIEYIMVHDKKLPGLDALREEAGYFGARRLQESLRGGRAAPENPLFAGFDELAAACDDLERTLLEWLLESRREVLEQAGGRIAQRVREVRGLGFNDLLVEMRDALRGGKGDSLAEGLRKRYPVALIDESQDTDPLQAQIFDQIYTHQEIDEGAAIYIVGDPKQSIYQFRGADIFAYLSTRREATKQLRLPANHRSAPALVSAVNEIFDAPLAFTLPDLEFTRIEPGRKDQGALELDTDAAPWLDAKPLQIRLAPDQKNNEEAIGAFVEDTAREISDLLRLAGAGGARLDGKPLRARDIAVLVRTHDEGGAIARALRERKVNCAETEQSSVFGVREAEQLHWLLRALANPERQDCRRVALTADMFGLDNAELLALSEDDEVWSGWRDRFEQLRELWRNGGVGAMLLRVLADADPSVASASRRQLEGGCGGARNLLLCADGPRRLTNLRHLAEILQHAETENRLSPAGLVSWLARERGKADAGDKARMLRLDSDEDLVKILTVHGSKGLEFPIVYLPFAWRGKSLTNPSERRDLPKSYHRREDGQFPAVLDAAPDLDAMRRWEMEQFGEHVRLLYVALTRARERCVVAWTRAGVRGNTEGKTRDSRGKHLPALAWLLQRTAEDNENLVKLSGGFSDYAVSVEVVKVYDEIRDRFVNGPRDRFDEQVAALAEKCPQGVSIEEVGNESIAAEASRMAFDIDCAGGGSAMLECREFQRPLRRRRQMTSFSSLIAQRGDAAAGLNPRLGPGAPDYDAAEVVVTENREEEGGSAGNGEPSPDDVPNFPRGVHVGRCLHAIFERWIEGRRQDVGELCLSQLRRHGLDAKWVGAARAMVENALSTELREPGYSVFRLSEIERQLVELEFTFPLREASRVRLGAVLDRHGYGHTLGVDEDDTPIEGFLRGFIDLSFAHGGRWYVLDYKSNWLGDQPEDYNPAKLSAAMAKHGYPLQYLLYLLALHRLLGTRLPDYDYDRHMGGAFYLFLRGMKPRSGMERGVFFDRPTRECIEDLDRLMRGGGA